MEKIRKSFVRIFSGSEQKTVLKIINSTARIGIIVVTITENITLEQKLAELEARRKRGSIKRTTSFFSRKSDKNQQRHWATLQPWSYAEIHESLDFSTTNYEMLVAIRFENGDQIELEIDQYDAVRGVFSKDFPLTGTEGDNYECSQIVTEDNINCFNIFERVDTARWMQSVSGTSLLSGLNIPGTHNSCANQAGMLNTAQIMAKCQNLGIREQCDAGIRYFDIRCRHMNNKFEIYHGPVSENMNFDQLMGEFLSFLRSSPKETLLVAIKEESSPTGNTRSFIETLHVYVNRYSRDYWYLDDTIPHLRKVRGKLVLIRRFPSPEPLGLDLSDWTNNNTTFEKENQAGWTYHIQDVYRTNNRDKIQRVQNSFRLASELPHKVLIVNMLSKTDIPTTPFTLAKEMNVKFHIFLTLQQHGKKVRSGITVMDFCEIPDSLIKQIISNNNFVGPIGRTVDFLMDLFV